MENSAVLRESLERLRRGEVPSEELYGLIHDLGHSELLEAVPDVAAHLGHPDPSIRMIAVRVLTFHWKQRGFKDELIRLMMADPDDWVRSFAATGLGSVYRETRDLAIAAALLTKIRDVTEDSNVREAAYDALVYLWDHRTVEEDIEELREQFALARAESADLELAISNEDFKRRRWLWDQEWQLKVSWELIKEVEVAIGERRK